MVFKEEMENIGSTGALFHDPGSGFYYTDGIYRSLVRLLGKPELIAHIIRIVSGMPGREREFMRVKLRRDHILFCNREEHVLLREEVPDTIPLPEEISLCIYCIGRTLLLPVEY
ncbi:hypothetical protein [Sinomicrobium soli]|uniref:hypothetical protein n=1 Tax=Sinomicrobium sp. N-1-3-6 TaxID=2219864 RepID=UPI0011BDC0B4|nr:hypothetical protein [Sinomicrobium sp. N-1-3-6]